MSGTVRRVLRHCVLIMLLLTASATQAAAQSQGVRARADTVHVAAPTGVRESDRAIVMGETITIRYGIPDEERRIHVQLPAGYEIEPDTRYPVLYVLDGDAPGAFAYVAGLIGFLASGYQLPVMIAVGVPNTSRTRVSRAPHGKW